MDNLTPIGKLFFTSLIGWINNGYKMNWKLRGSPEKINAITKVIIASRRFQEETKKPDATIDSIMSKMQDKKKAIEEYEKLFNAKWPI